MTVKASALYPWPFFLFSIKTVIAVHLQDPHTAPCLRQVIQLNCSHPFNDGSLTVGWERNRTRIVIQGKLEHSYIIANVHVTRDTFNDKVWMYRCYTLHIDTTVREYSNEVVIDTVGERIFIITTLTIYLHYCSC